MRLPDTPNSPTTTLLNTVGSPFIHPNKVCCPSEPKTLYEYADKNKVRLLYLKSLERNSCLATLAPEYKTLQKRYYESIEATSRVSKALEKAGVKYVFFKTIRPYPEVTVDIDTLIFNDYDEANKALHQANFILLDSGPLSTTFYDNEAKINVDIYNEIGVSHFIYMDKTKLEPLRILNTRLDDKTLKCLHPVADLLAIISHSLIKEQMYVLSEYYTTIFYIHQMSNKDRDDILKLAKEWKLQKAVSTHLSISAVLHKNAHGNLPTNLKKLLNEVGFNFIEVSRLMAKNLLMPYKYSPYTVLEAVKEKITEAKARRSTAAQIYHMMNPVFLSSVTREAFKHVVRKKY